MADKTKRFAPSMSDPAVGSLDVTPSDTVNMTHICRALYVGVGGNIYVLYKDGVATQLFKNVPTGSILPVQVMRVNATSTTATDIVGLY